VLHKLTLALLAALFAAALAAPRPAAGAGIATLTFTMPQGADPQDFFYSFDGQFFDIPGNYLLSPGLGGLGGANLHAAAITNLEFSQLKITNLTYPGMTEYLTGTDPGLGSFAPWSVFPQGVIHPPNPCYLTAKPGSARIGQRLLPSTKYFGLLEVTGISSADAALFGASLIRVQAFVNPQAIVPEPGILAMAGSLLAAGFIPYLRRYRRRTR
jgi:hypothetical protein